MGGVGALVDQGSPGDRVALAVGGAGGVAVVGVCSEELAVDLDDRDAGDVAGGVAESCPGAQATGTGRPAIAGTSAVMASESFFQGPAGAASPGAGARAVADIGGGPFRWRRAGGLDLAAEGEGGDRLAGEGPGYGVGYYVAVLLGGDADQVGDGGGLAEDAGDLGVGEELAELGAQPISPLACRAARSFAALIARGSILRAWARSKSVVTLTWTENLLERASVRIAPWTPGLWPATT